MKEAFRKGALGSVVSKEVKLPPRYKKRTVRVKDTIKALGESAKAHRLKFNIPVVAITGSSGKTTAKDMVSFVLSGRYSVLRNETSKNNLIGLPLTLLRLKKSHQIAVLEMGINQMGEIEKLCALAMPQTGVITNIGPSHLEFLGTLQNVFRAKAGILKGLPVEGLALLNTDDPYLGNIRGLKCRKTYFGIKGRCSFQAKNLRHKGSRWFFSIGAEGGDFELGLLGKHNIYNALIAVCIARNFGMSFSAIKKRLKLYRQANQMRLELKKVCGFCILDDSYNSNPLSMEGALEALTSFHTNGKRILVSGDMLELGNKAKAMHEALGRDVSKRPVDFLITLGALSKYSAIRARENGMAGVYHADSHARAAKFLKKVAGPGDIILVKGSRGMKMEKVIEKLKPA